MLLLIEWQTDALNQMYPNYKVSPGVGGRMDFNPTERKLLDQVLALILILIGKRHMMNVLKIILA
jgi:hypothetical protein